MSIWRKQNKTKIYITDNCSYIDYVNKRLASVYMYHLPVIDLSGSLMHFMFHFEVFRLRLNPTINPAFVIWCRQTLIHKRREREQESEESRIIYTIAPPGTKICNLFVIKVLQAFNGQMSRSLMKDFPWEFCVIE